MKPFDKKSVWVIKNFSSLISYDNEYYSVPFLIGDIKWRLIAYPEESNGVDYLSVYLEAVGVESNPIGWRQYIEFRFTIVNQYWKNLSVMREGQHWFDEKAPTWGFKDMIPLTLLTITNSEFMVNGELMIKIEVDAFGEISSDDSEWTSLDSSSSFESVNGFHVLDSQVSQVKEIFKKHPDLTSNFSLKSQQLKNAYMNVLLDLIKTLSKSANELTKEDLNKAESMLSDLTKTGFKLDWLRQKLDEALEKQRADQALEFERTCDTSYVLRLRNFFI